MLNWDSIQVYKKLLHLTQNTCLINVSEHFFFVVFTFLSKMQKWETKNISLFNKSHVLYSRVYVYECIGLLYSSWLTFAESIRLGLSQYSRQCLAYNRH